jgi:hypothetical protein
MPVDPKVKPVKQFILKPAADIEPKDLKKPKGVNKKVWEKMTEVEKRAQIQAIAQAEFDATNLAVKQALASRSGSLKRQSSSANIDQEANKNAATNGDGQSASNSLSVNTDDVLD